MPVDILQLSTPEKIDDISSKYGFRPDTMERFLMDYLVHQRVAEGIECVTKGGMCMPFYSADGTLQRLSVDVDLLTNLSVDRVESAVNLAANIGNVIQVEKHTPSRQTVLKNNLVTYHIRYKSYMGLEQQVKVDFLHDLDVGYGAKTVPAGKMITEFETPHDMKILTKSALMADKFGALATGTVGLDEGRVDEMAKQVFDVGMLLRGASVDDIAGFFTEFHNMLEAQKTITGKSDLDACGVVDSIKTALDGMLVLKGAVNFDRHSKKGYLDFNSRYISKTIPYGRIDHQADILSIRVLNRMVGQVLGGMGGGKAAAWMRRMLDEAAGVQDYEDVQGLYDRHVREATGIRETHLERANARLSYLLCAHASLVAG